MRIIEYFTTENKEHWLNEIKKCDWGAGQYLYRLLCKNNLKKTVGETALVPMLVEGDELISFCTFAPLDDIQPTSLSPWIGFLYTFPKYRGHRYAGMLLDYAESIATVMGREYIYISTNHIGLYENMDMSFLRRKKTSMVRIHGYIEKLSQQRVLKRTGVTRMVQSGRLKL